MKLIDIFRTLQSDLSRGLNADSDITITEPCNFNLRGYLDKEGCLRVVLTTTVQVQMEELDSIFK